jgi:hypothetical protein
MKSCSPISKIRDNVKSSFEIATSFSEEVINKLRIGRRKFPRGNTKCQTLYADNAEENSKDILSAHNATKTYK